MHHPKPLPGPVNPRHQCGLLFPLQAGDNPGVRNIFRHFFEQRQDDSFVTLVQIALEDPDIHQHLVAILSIPHPQRAEKIQQWTKELQQEGAPAELITALSYLKDDARARKTLQILTSCSL